MWKLGQEVCSAAQSDETIIQYSLASDNQSIESGKVESRAVFYAQDTIEHNEGADDVITNNKTSAGNVSKLYAVFDIMGKDKEGKVVRISKKAGSFSTDGTKIFEDTLN